MKKRVEDFQQSDQRRQDAWTSTVELPPIDQQNVSALKNEDRDFIDEFNRVVGPEELSHSDSELEFGPDNWLNVEVGVNLEERRF